MPMVVKSSGNRVPYDREKLRTGFMRALHKRPVPTEYVDQSINRIEQRVLALGEREVASRVIGEMVMRELKKMDDVAYIRFASVYEDRSEERRVGKEWRCGRWRDADKEKVVRERNK